MAMTGSATSAVADASGVMPSLIEGPLTETAVAVLANYDLIAPDLFVTETANALWKHARAGDLTGPVAARLLHNALSIMTIKPSPPLIDRAMDIAAAFAHSAYDCFYLALAEREKAPIITADARLAALAERTRAAKPLLLQSLREKRP